VTSTAPIPHLPVEVDGGRSSGGWPALPEGGAVIVVNGTRLFADCAGALYWPEQGALIVADLHLEKGSSFARFGMLLPPYDTAETLARLALIVARYDPTLVIALGDNFHDGDGAARLSAADRASLELLQRQRQWLWITGNHDPDPVAGVGGTCADVVALGPVVFRHQPMPGCADGEIAGHLHPSARMSHRGRGVVRRCFASNGRRLVMPAFGAYAGGLDIHHRAFAPVFGGRDFDVHLLGTQRLYGFAASRCL
jgi:DNA ligase-associated metallophosphoesterase